MQKSIIPAFMLSATLLLMSAALPAGGQQTATTADTQVLAQGSFIRGDRRHPATGSVEIQQTDAGHVLTLSDDFSVRNGPDLFVYLTTSENGEPSDEYVSLGRLKNPQGGQSYALPENFSDFQTVVIWCRAFGVNFGYANY